MSRGFSRDDLRAGLSRDGSRDVLAEVRVQTPLEQDGYDANHQAELQVRWLCLSFVSGMGIFVGLSGIFVWPGSEINWDNGDDEWEKHYLVNLLLKNTHVVFN